MFVDELDVSDFQKKPSPCQEFPDKRRIDIPVWWKIETAS
jgi:hypothetical protein